MQEARVAATDDLVFRLLEIAEEKNLKLSVHAVMLLSVATSAWINELPKLDAEHYRSLSDRKASAEAIFQEALTDDHIDQDEKLEGHVTFFSLLYSLGQSGKEFLEELGTKGF